MSKISYIQLPADAMTVDPATQRSLAGRWAAKLANGFNPDFLGVLVVSVRDDGSVVILDGQHRHAAAKMSGYKDPLPCIAHHGLTHEEEARLFAELNTTLKVQAIDRFRIRVEAGDPTAVDINRMLHLYGWKVSPGKANGNFAAVVAAERIYNGAGVLKGKHPALVKGTLKVINDAYGLDYNGSHNSIVSGVGVLLARFGKRVETERLSHVMAKVVPVRLVAQSKALMDMQKGNSANAMAHIIVGLYNTGLRQGSRLPDWNKTR
jgi:hypothetical protein